MGVICTSSSSKEKENESKANSKVKEIESLLKKSQQSLTKPNLKPQTQITKKQFM